MFLNYNEFLFILLLNPATDSDNLSVSRLSARPALLLPNRMASVWDFILGAICPSSDRGSQAPAPASAQAPATASAQAPAVVPDSSHSVLSRPQRQGHRQHRPSQKPQVHRQRRQARTPTASGATAGLSPTVTPFVPGRAEHTPDGLTKADLAAMDAFEDELDRIYSPPE